MGRRPERANHPRCAHAPHVGCNTHRSFEKFRQPRRAQPRRARIALVGIGAIRRHDRRGDHGANALRVRSGNGEKFCRIPNCETSQARIDRCTHEYREHSRFLVRHPSRRCRGRQRTSRALVVEKWRDRRRDAAALRRRCSIGGHRRAKQMAGNAARAVGVDYSYRPIPAQYLSTTRPGRSSTTQKRSRGASTVSTEVLTASFGQ